MGGRHSFLKGCLAEGGLLVVALFCGRVFGPPPLGTLEWDSAAVLKGCVAVLPAFALFLYTLQASATTLVRHRELLDALLRPLMAGWSLLQLAGISLLAGICEEALFRGFLQGALQSRLGWISGLVLASVFFGFAHPLSRTYIVMAALVGTYFGLLWIWTGNLLTPVTTHVVYDFLALVYFLRIRRPSQAGVFERRPRGNGCESS